jgi:hypothetical protein
MRSWIHHTRGRYVRQARVGLGDLREEHISRQGFFGPVAMVYREHGPNEIVPIEGPIYPRRVADTARAEPTDQHDPRGMPEVMLSNADVSVQAHGVVGPAAQGQGEVGAVAKIGAQPCHGGRQCLIGLVRQ